MSTLWKDKKRTFLGLPWSLTSYELTEDRLLIRTGLLTQVEDEVRLYRIVDVTLVRTLRQRLWGLGTIHCCSTDATQKEFDIANIRKSRAVKDLLSELVEEERANKHVYQRESIEIDNSAHPDKD